MFRLNVPEQLNDPAGLGLDTKRESVEKWLRELPLANVERCARELLEKSTLLNSIRLEPVSRYQLMQLLQPVAENLIESLRHGHCKALLPLSPRHHEGFKLAMDLGNAIAAGFKAILRDLLAQKYPAQKLEPLLLTSLYMAIHHLSLMLLDTYVVYFPEPARVWEEINHLYLFAESRGTQDIPILQQDETSEPRTISLAYKRAVLLALANPYHLMQDEASTVFKLLHKLSATCEIQRPHPDHRGSCFFIDLKADAPPRFAPVAEKIQAIEPRILDVSRLLGVLHKRIEALSGEDEEDAGRKTPHLVRRMHRDMLRRLLGGWGRTSDRQHDRSVKLGGINLAIGLSACQHFISHEEPFAPELDEIRIHTGRTPEPSTKLSLLPLDYEHWKLEEEEHRLQAGIQQPRTSHFEIDKMLDVWQKIYATENRHGLHDSEDSALHPKYETSCWERKNQSEHGLGLSCEAARSMPVRVGELIAYQADTCPEENRTCMIGAIRWLRVYDNRLLEMGVMRLSENARSVATRALKGAGEGGEYFRSLIIPNLDLEHDSATLIAPAAIYDTDTQLAVNLKDSIRYVRLTEILGATKAYAHFKFELVEMPDSERKNIKAMRALV